MNKKFLAAGAGLAVLALSASFVLTMGKTGATTLAGEVTHSHGSSCTIHHYAQVDPTSEKSGVKEYWICCSDPTHKVSFSNPGVGNITDATHGGDFVIDSSDDRYIAPYTFPEVFSSQMAYDTAVTVTNGKVTSSTGAIRIKGSVLKDAYDHGYTHMKFHSNSESAEVTNILGSSKNWKNYYKRYQNNQDNRFWLKSFSETSEYLNIDSLNLGNHVDTNITLSDFTLFKSSLTESWGENVSSANRYVALENGELVMDNCGSNKGAAFGSIPAEYWSSAWGDISMDREFFMKKLADGGYQDTTVADETVQFNIPMANQNVIGYHLVRTAGTGDTEDKTEDGFSNVLYRGFAAGFGLRAKDYYTGGDFNMVVSNPSAYAIRINFDIYPSYKASGLSYKVTPLPFTSDNKFQIALTNFTAPANGQSNIPFVSSKEHKGISLKITSDFDPSGSFMMDYTVSKANLSYPTYAEADGIYSWSGDLTFKTDNPGMSFIVKNPNAVTNGTLVIEYSWID